jgi:hypothetical protein
MGLYKGGLIYGWAYTWTIFCVSNKQVRHKQVGHKKGNKRVLSSDYWAYINWGTYIRGAYIRGGLIFGGGAYIWIDVSVSTCGGLIHRGGLYSGGAYIRGGGLIVGGLRYDIILKVYLPGYSSNSSDNACSGYFIVTIQFIRCKL